MGSPRPFQGTGLSGEAQASHWGGGWGYIKDKKTKLTLCGLGCSFCVGPGVRAARSAQSLGSRLSLTASEVSLERAAGVNNGRGRK